MFNVVRDLFLTFNITLMCVHVSAYICVPNGAVVMVGRSSGFVSYIKGNIRSFKLHEVSLNIKRKPWPKTYS